MPLLSNPRHEAFALAMAEGKLSPQCECARVAGFTGTNDSLAVTASRLLKHAQVVERIQEIRILLGAEAIKAAGISKCWVIETLKENVERAMQHEAVMDVEGNETGEYRYEGSVANRSLELIGKELGMFVERKQITVDDLRKMPTEQIMGLIAQLESEGESQGVVN